MPKSLDDYKDPNSQEFRGLDVKILNVMESDPTGRGFNLTKVSAMVRSDVRFSCLESGVIAIRMQVLIDQGFILKDTSRPAAIIYRLPQ